ncbi:unnamed protein product [Heterobilharzia americana]|nr:unnamed protein product [Heterobilharzia americana]
MHSVRRVCDSLFVVVGGAVISGAIYLLYCRKDGRHICGFSDLPIGLPNPRNVCYFNALMQAIAANPSIVRILRRSARIRPDKFIFRLLCLLKGLQCSSQYIAEHKLDVVLRKNHEALINDIVNTQHWAIHEQQDAHELFGFIMERACGQDNDFLSQTTARKMSDLFNFSLPHYERIVVCRSHSSVIESVKFQSVLCDAFPTRAFEQTLVASRVTCNSCNYHSKVVIQPEACLTVFLKNSSTADSTSIKTSSQESWKALPKVIDLVECLDAQSATVEPLPDMKCPKCQKSSTSKSCSQNNCQREQWITHTPKYLVLYIQRSDWLNISSSSVGSNNTNQFNRNSFPTARIATKRSEHVHIPECLDMAPYLSENKISKRTTSSQTTDLRGNKVVELSSPRTMRLSQGDDLKTYTLRSVIVHEGAFLQCGHYITYRKWRNPMLSEQEKRYWLVRGITTLYQYISNYFQGIPTSSYTFESPWILTSDSHVMRVPFKQVQSSPAYLLFYERLCGSKMYSNEIIPMVNANGTDHPTKNHITLLSIEEIVTKDSEIYSDEDESDSYSLNDKQHRFKKLSKADTIRAYASYASKSQIYDKSYDVFYSQFVLFVLKGYSALIT